MNVHWYHSISSFMLSPPLLVWSEHSRLFAFALLPDEKTLAYNLMWIHLKELLGNHYTATSLLCNIELAAIKVGKLILKLCLFANILSRFSFKCIRGE